MKLFFSVLSILFITSCKSSFDELTITSGDANFQRVVAVGGSFLSGYQDGALFLDGQEHSVPALLSEQFQKAQGGTFLQPLISDYSGLGINLLSWKNHLQKRAILGYYTDCNGDRSLFPLQDSINVSASTPYVTHITYTLYNNLSVPFAKSIYLTNPAFGISLLNGNANPFYSRFASNPGSSTILDDAMRIAPTFYILWTGMEDVYNYALAGASEGQMTTVPEFSHALDSILMRLSTSGTRGIIANIPALNSFPFFTTVSPLALTLDSLKADSLNLLAAGTVVFHEGDNGFLIEDKSTTAGARLMTSDDMVLLNVPLDSVKCNYLGSLMVIPSCYILDKNEIASVNSQIDLFNQTISAKADKYKIPMVDMNAYFKKLKSGISEDGVHYTAEFIKGGFYSLDGFHPTQKGYGLIANEFIRSINTFYKSNLPLTLCSGCAGIKFP